MANFPVKLGGARQANADVLHFIPQSIWPVQWDFWYHQVVDVTSSALTLPAAGTYAIDLNTVFPRNTFPQNVDILAGSKIRLVRAFSGGAISDFDVELGDATDPNGLLTATDVFGEALGYYTTPAAAEYAQHPESAFEPQLLLTATGANVDAVVAGIVEVFIPWAPLKEL